MTDKIDRTKPFLHKELCYQVLEEVYATRKVYGSSQKETAYQNGLAEELDEHSLPYKQEVGIKIISPKTGKIVGKHRLDFIINTKVILETKAMTYTSKKIEDQLYTYLRSTPYKIGYLINFASTKLYIKRIILTNDRKRFLNLSSVRSVGNLKQRIQNKQTVTDKIDLFNP